MVDRKLDSGYAMADPTQPSLSPAGGGLKVLCGTLRLLKKSKSINHKGRKVFTQSSQSPVPKAIGINVSDLTLRALRFPPCALRLKILFQHSQSYTEKTLP
jgi:hypothetical protein